MANNNKKKKAPSKSQNQTKKVVDSAAVQTVSEQAETAVKTDAADKAKKPAKATKQTKKKPNKILKFFKDLKGEIKKVVWPSFNKVVNNTTVVLVTMIISGLVIWGFDSGLIYVLGKVLKLQ